MDMIFSTAQLSFMRKAPFVGLAFMVAAALSLSACGGDTPAPQSRIVLDDQKEQGVGRTLTLKPGQSLSDDSLLNGSPQKSKIALLVPLSGPAAQTGKAMLNAATLALFDAYDPNLALRPYDTKGTIDGAKAAAQQALNDGTTLVLGPLFADNVIAVSEILTPAGVNILAFSNDPRAAGVGRYLMGFLVADEMKRLVNYARNNGAERFASLAPQNRYGDQVQQAYGDAVINADAEFVAFARYSGGAESYDEPVKALADYDARRKAYRDEVSALRALNDDLADEILQGLKNTEVLGEVGFDSLLIAEGGERLRALAPLMPFYEIDPKQIRFLGTGLWHDAGNLREPPLQGGWFAAPSPEAPDAFLARYNTLYNVRAPRIATIAYDAMALTAALYRQSLTDGLAAFDAARLENTDGFTGIDGPFRFFSTGMNERALAVLEVRRKGFQVIDPAPEGFSSYGYAVNPQSNGQEGR